mmetsp:Transcript_118352/g.342149  ORF Transcript_118352/g.342149 Transcript_118352/m.342149 type:complete len:307 (-) Transcript_118352:155-1075(-)
MIVAGSTGLQALQPGSAQLFDLRAQLPLALVGLVQKLLDALELLPAFLKGLNEVLDIDHIAVIVHEDLVVRATMRHVDVPGKSRGRCGGEDTGHPSAPFARRSAQGAANPRRTPHVLRIHARREDEDAPVSLALKVRDAVHAPVALADGVVALDAHPRALGELGWPDEADDSALAEDHDALADLERVMGVGAGTIRCGEAHRLPRMRRRRPGFRGGAPGRLGGARRRGRRCIGSRRAIRGRRRRHNLWLGCIGHGRGLGRSDLFQHTGISFRASLCAGGLRRRGLGQRRCPHEDPVLLWALEVAMV